VTGREGKAREGKVRSRRERINTDQVDSRLWSGTGDVMRCDMIVYE
jgi:hypothetical protein